MSANSEGRATSNMFCFAVNNAEFSSHAFLLRAGRRAPLDSHSAPFETVAMWLAVRCCQHMGISQIQGVTKLTTEFELNDYSMNIQAREHCSFRG
jgi:hypothetical protein